MHQASYKILPNVLINIGNKTGGLAIFLYVKTSTLYLFNTSFNHDNVFINSSICVIENKLEVLNSELFYLQGSLEGLSTEDVGIIQMYAMLITFNSYWNSNKVI